MSKQIKSEFVSFVTESAGKLAQKRVTIGFPKQDGWNREALADEKRFLCELIDSADSADKKRFAGLLIEVLDELLAAINERCVDEVLGLAIGYGALREQMSFVLATGLNTAMPSIWVNDLRRTLLRLKELEAARKKSAGDRRRGGYALSKEEERFALERIDRLMASGVGKTDACLRTKAELAVERGVEVSLSTLLRRLNSRGN